ncbi:DUF4961 domain-containing protein [Flavobacterium psychrotrophum]|uniref:DUF4961 domain-containing protein n=1 Tax=Flavobacterium psychrotrophum TaxID=2294119 RepID=UPI000E30E2BB|nr:DUF4961 domain-containing protein [Flavobacterium psychrotrophum]
MKNITKIFKSKRLLALAALALLVTSCVYLDGVETPNALVAGETAEFTMSVRVELADDIENERLIIGVLMPASWNPATNVTVNYTSTNAGDEGVQTMTLIPDSVLPAHGGTNTWPQHLAAKFGVGPNAAGSNMQWVAFQSDKVYSFTENATMTAAVKIRALVGNENLTAQMGFFVNNSSDGLSDDADRWKVSYSDCMPVTGGTGTVNNYCTPTAGTDGFEKAVKIAAYPNPFTDKISFPLGVNAGTAYEVSIFDTTGRKVKAFKGAATDNNEVFNFDNKLGTGDLTSGIYMVTVKSGKATSSFRIIKK